MKLIQFSSKIDTCGAREFVTPAHLHQGLRPSPRRVVVEDIQLESKYPRNVVEDDPVLGIPRPRREERHVVKNRPESAPRKKGKYSRTCTRVQYRAASRKSCHFRIECTNKRLGCINGKRLLNNMVSVTATNRRWGKTADGTRTQVVICLINRWEVRIKLERLYNARIPSWRGRGAKTETMEAVSKKESSLIHLAHSSTSILNTMTIGCPFAKTQPFNPRSTNLLFGPLTYDSILNWDRYKLSPYNWRRLWEGLVRWHRRSLVMVGSSPCQQGSFKGNSYGNSASYATAPPSFPAAHGYCPRSNSHSELRLEVPGAILGASNTKSRLHNFAEGLILAGPSIPVHRTYISVGQN